MYCLLIDANEGQGKAFHLKTKDRIPKGVQASCLHGGNVEQNGFPRSRTETNISLTPRLSARCRDMRATRQLFQQFQKAVETALFLLHSQHRAKAVRLVRAYVPRDDEKPLKRLGHLQNSSITPLKRGVNEIRAGADSIGTFEVPVFANLLFFSPQLSYDA